MEELQIREITRGDLPALLELYTHLHEPAVPPVTAALEAVFGEILGNQNHHLLAGVVGGALVSSCACIVVRNLTHGARPYVLVENVVTHAAYRGRGYATALLARAKAIAGAEGCYKLMLMTGAKDESTLRFYENAGYNRHDKTGFILWL